MNYDVAVIGGGPAGLAAAVSACAEGASVLLIEREARLGGILKQCVHDGFGLITFGEKLSGPEYCERFIDRLLETNTEIRLLTFVTKIERTPEGFCISLVSREGVSRVFAKAIVLATGCRERTAKQVFIHGTRPAGIFTAGTAQSYVNLMGELPTRRCVILGSGDIGLIMARRLTLEGANVLGVYEAKPTPSGLTRNIHQCLNDFDIPLHLSHTVTRVFGDERLTAVEVSEVDGQMQPVAGTQERIECDSLILSVGLIPENELAESIGVTLSAKTKGPVCDQRYMTDIPGVFCCGNALHVSDLVDYVTECAELAGKGGAHYAAGERRCIGIEAGENVLYTVPSVLDINAPLEGVTVYFRAARELRGARLSLKLDGKTVFERKYSVLRPPEMQRLIMDFGKLELTRESRLSFGIEEGE